MRKRIMSHPENCRFDQQQARSEQNCRPHEHRAQTPVANGDDAAYDLSSEAAAVHFGIVHIDNPNAGRLPGIFISQAIRRPVPSIVMYAVRMSAPPKQMFDGRGSLPSTSISIQSMTSPLLLPSVATTAMPPRVFGLTPCGIKQAT